VLSREGVEGGEREVAMRAERQKEDSIFAEKRQKF